MANIKDESAENYVSKKIGPCFHKENTKWVKGNTIRVDNAKGFNYIWLDLSPKSVLIRCLLIGLKYGYPVLY